MWLSKLLPAASIFSINPSVHGVGRRFSGWESLLCQCEEQNSNPQKPRKARCDSIYLQSQCSYGEVGGRDGSALKVSCIGVGSSKQETLSQTRRKIPNAIQVCPLTFTDKLWHTVHIVTREHIHTKNHKNTQIEWSPSQLTTLSNRKMGTILHHTVIHAKHMIWCNI